MKKAEIIKYIRDNDDFFQDAHLEAYSYHELMLIKISIDTDREKAKIKNSSADILGSFS